MNWFRQLISRRKHQRDLSKHIRQELQERPKEPVATGMPGNETATAHREFGSLSLIEKDSGEGWRWPSIENCFSDIRFGLRALRKSPGFTIVVVLTLALGIGSTTAVFSVLKAVVLDPLPYRNADRLAVLWTDNQKQNLHEERTSYPNFEDWRKQAATFADMAFCSAFTVNLTAGDEPERIVAGRSSANLFDLMGVQPVLGRAFTNEEAERGERLVMLSHRLWKRRFGSSRDVIGKSLEIDGVEAVIVGIMPPTFQVPTRDTELWEPLTLFPNWNALKVKRDIPSGFVIGRLRPQVGFAQAQADMNVIGSRLARQYPQLAASLDFFGFSVNVESLRDYVIGRQVSVALWLLFGAVALVLLIASSNVASLLLSHGLGRAQELAIRSALGATKTRIVQQLLTESILLFLISGVCGIALAAVGGRLMILIAPADIPRLNEAGFDGGVFVFALGLSLVVALAFGLAPSLRLSSADPQSALRESGRSHSGAPTVVRFRSLLVAFEFAVAVILVTGAGLLIRSFLTVEGLDPGFKPDHVLTVRVVQSKSKSEAQWADFYNQALERLRHISGVQAAGAIDNFFFRSYPDEAVVVEGRPSLPAGSSIAQVTDDGVSPGYFEAAGVPLRRGRFLTEQDGPVSPRTAVINVTMARHFWPDEDPVGRRFKFAYQGTGDPWTTVVGVVGDMRRDDLTKEPVSEIFLPISQHPARGMDIVVRTAGDPRALSTVVREAIHSVDRTAPLFNVSTLEDALHDQLAPRRFQISLLSLFAMLALILSTVGIYGLLQYSVTQRTHEMGIRMALGATQVDILRQVLGQGTRLALIGITIGVGVALAATHALASSLYGVTPTDPATFLAVAMLFGLVAVVASYIPARRAMRVDPIVALRYE
jgi:putative ABC transport system permease protein